MRPDDPDTGEQDLLRRYRDASAGDDPRPQETTRAAILAEARRIAAEQSRPEALKPFDTRTGAANQGRWRLAVGSVGVAVLAALLMVPYYRGGPSPSRAMIAEPASNTAVSPAVPAPPADHAPVTAELAPDAPASTDNLAAPAAKPLQKLTVNGATRLREESLEQDKARDSAGDTRAGLALSAQSARRAAAPSANAYAHADSPAPPGTPASLLQAVRLGDLDQAAALLEQGASVSAVDDAGRSALFLAVLQDRADLVRLLLAHGADPSVADRKGHTPLQWARQQHAEEMVRLLSPPLATK